MPNSPTPTLLQGVITAVFLGTWVVLGAVSLVVFWLGRDTSLKRTWWPRFVILGGILFVIFSTTIAVLGSQTWGSLGILVVVVPAVALI